MSITDNMKRICTILALAIFTLAGASTLRAEEKHRSYEKGFFAGVSGGLAGGVSTFKSERPSFQVNVEGGYRFNKWLSLQLVMGGGRLDIGPQECCSAHPGINNERHSYWRALNNNEWHYYPDKTADGWWYADMNGTTSYCKGVIQVNFDLFSFFSDRIGLDISPRAGGMVTRTDLSGKSSLTGDALALKDDRQKHFVYGGESTLSYKFGNGIRLGVFGALDILTGDHFDNIPVHAHNENRIWNAGVKFIYSFGKGGN